MGHLNGPFYCVLFSILAEDGFYGDDVSIFLDQRVVVQSVVHISFAIHHKPLSSLCLSSSITDSLYRPWNVG